MPQPKPSIFISYGRGDDHEDFHDPAQSFLRKLYSDLTTAGYKIWWDRESMPSRGLTFMQEIQDAITHHDRLILIVGPHAVQSDYVRYEWQYANRICKPITPILLKRDPTIHEDNHQYGQIPDVLAGYHALNALNWHDADIYKEMLEELERILGEDAPLGDVHALPQLPPGYIEREGFKDLQQDLLIKIENPAVIAPHEQIVSVQGTGGIGKSTLASALGWSCEVRRHFVDGVYWIRLGKVNETDIVARQATLGRQLGDDGANYVDEDSGRTRLSHLLADKKALLILDDVWDYHQKEAFDVLGINCRLLMTTRQRSIARRAGIEPHKLNKLTEEEGLLLIGGWLERKPEDPNPHEAEEREIIRLLDGYTLAIAIAAAKLADTVAGYTHELLLKRLQAGRTFKDLKLDDEDKNVNLEKTLYLSYEDLSPVDQKRFEKLGVLATNAEFDQQLIGAVWGDEDEFDTEDALNRLVSAALLDKDDSGRWKQHSVLRAYAQALMQDEEYESALVNYVHYVIDIAEQFQQLPVQEWDGQIGPYYPHIDFIGDTLVSFYEQIPDSYRNIAGVFIWAVQRYVTDRPVMRDTPEGKTWRGIHWLQTGVQLFAELDNKESQATTLNNIGLIYDALGHKQLALDYYQQALPIFAASGDRAGQATTLNNIGLVYWSMGELDTAYEYYQRALPISREENDTITEATTLNNIGVIHQSQGEMNEALAVFEQALAMHHEQGNRAMEATTLNNIGKVHDALGNKEEALDYFQRAQPLFDSLGNRTGVATMHNNIGLVYWSQGKMDEALAEYQLALPIFAEVGNRSGEATSLGNIAVVYQTRGQTDEALSYLEQSLPMHRAVGNRSMEATTLNNIGQLYQTRGQVEVALQYLEQALDIHREVKNHAVAATTLNNIALIHIYKSEFAQAVETFKAIIPIIQEIGAVPEEALYRYNLGYTYQQMGLISDAIDEMKNAINLLRSKGLTRDAGGQTVEQMESYLQEISHIKQSLLYTLNTEGEARLREILQEQGVTDAIINTVIRALHDDDQD